MGERKSQEGRPEDAFAHRLARSLHLKPHQQRSFTLESSHSRLSIRLGKVDKKEGHRPILIEGILRWHGIEYEFSVDDVSGKGEVEHVRQVQLFDRATGRMVEQEVSEKIYETLVPIIELQIDSISERSRKQKS